MAAKQQPTNAELLREIKGLQVDIMRIDGRLEAVEVWKISTDASNAAVEKYKMNLQRSKSDKTKLEILQALLPFIVALTALAYGIITYLGRFK